MSVSACSRVNDVYVHSYVQMSAPASLGGNICCRASDPPPVAVCPVDQHHGPTRAAWRRSCLVRRSLRLESETLSVLCV